MSVLLQETRPVATNYQDSLSEKSIYPPPIYHKILDYRVVEILLGASVVAAIILFTRFHH
jgi:hypothetical protein